MYRVKLHDFEGPLDLLLFFIRRDELDIYDIPISSITEEYLSYVTILEEIDLDVAGDFIYMASVLIGIKAKMLLPRPETDEEGEPIDPRKELVERLLEYIRYKEASQQLTEQKLWREQIYTKGITTELQPTTIEEIDYQVSVFNLIHALKRVLATAPPEVVHEVKSEIFSVDEQKDFVLERVGEAKKISFVTLVQDRSRGYIIATFLAILELARNQLIRILETLQTDDFVLTQIVVAS